jgi:hypothetical protein
MTAEKFAMIRYVSKQIQDLKVESKRLGALRSGVYSRWLDSRDPIERAAIHKVYESYTRDKKAVIAAINDFENKLTQIKSREVK